MDPGLSQYPEGCDLVAGLAVVLGQSAGASEQPTLVARKPNGYASTFPSEIVTIRMPNGSSRTAFCKYDRRLDHDFHGHRHDLLYEGRVYSRILQANRMGTPRLYGVHKEPHTGQTWLIFENIDAYIRLDKAPGANALGDAAAWIGSFHRIHENDVSRAAMRFLTRYDDDYYSGWAHRSMRFTRHLHEGHPWLPSLCRRYLQLVPQFRERPPTIIHGEYSPHNILVREGQIHPVDWQCAAIAPGEIDLACLIDGWSETAAEAARSRYTRARWPHGAPADFRRTLDAALLYIQLRWLGDRPEWVEKSPARLEQIRSIGARLHLI